jgi:hypothetical protein
MMPLYFPPATRETRTILEIYAKPHKYIGKFTTPPGNGMAVRQNNDDEMMRNDCGFVIKGNDFYP